MCGWRLELKVGVKELSTAPKRQGDGRVEVEHQTAVRRPGAPRPGGSPCRPPWRGPPSAHLCWSWAWSLQRSWRARARARAARRTSRRSSSPCRHWSQSPLQPSQLRGHHCSWSRSNERLKTSWLGRATLNNILTLNKARDFQAEPTASAKTAWQPPGSECLGAAEMEPSRWLINSCNSFLKI